MSVTPVINPPRPAFNNSNQPEPITSNKVNVAQTAAKTPLLKNKLFVGALIAVAVVVGLALVAGVILIILFGTVPCKLIKCNSRASTCVNHPFKAQCICDYGYNGDGISYCDECGLVYQNKNVKIVDGTDAVSYSWPSMVAVEYSFTVYIYVTGVGYQQVSRGYFCGGVLIDRTTVLTAGHCVPTILRITVNNKDYTVSVNPQASNYRVVLGGYKQTDFGESPSSYASVSAVVRNPNYNSDNALNDIAILKLSSEATLNQYVQIACMPNPSKSGYPDPNQDGYIVGWGKLLSTDTTTPDTLQNAKITIQDTSDCSNVLPSYEKDWDSQICAGEINGKDTCQGDSGGPLFTEDTVLGKTRYVVAGLTSYGDGCGLKPGIYTRVSYFYDWIQDEKFYKS